MPPYIAGAYAAFCRETSDPNFEDFALYLHVTYRLYIRNRKAKHAASNNMKSTVTPANVPDGTPALSGCAVSFPDDVKFLSVSAEHKVE